MSVEPIDENKPTYQDLEALLAASQKRIRKLEKLLEELQTRHGWCGQIDRMGGGHDPNERHEMGG